MIFSKIKGTLYLTLMYHWALASLLVSLPLATCHFFGQPAFAKDIAAPQPDTTLVEVRQKVERDGNEYPILLAKLKIKTKPSNPQIYQFDRQALGDRKPLLLVHGLKGEYWPSFRWGRVIKRFLDYPDFQRHYKIYLVRYDSTTALDNVLPKFKEALIELYNQTGGKQVSVLALSLGGSLMQRVMLDKEIDSRIRLVFTLATPHHGSPLFSTDWLQFSIYKNFYQPWTKIDHSIGYRAYFKLNPNLVHDLRWDNADGLMPDVGSFKSRLPLGPRGNLTLARDASQTLNAISQSSEIDKSKFITYGGYLINPYLLPNLKRNIEIALFAPYAFITWKLPSHLAREHPVLKFINRDISRVPPAQRTNNNQDWPYPYGLNDGITPVSSALFLPNDALKAVPLGREQDTQKIAKYIDVRLARVFRNVDHLTFVDGYRPNQGTHLLRDELNPNDGWRTMFDWLLSDLMQSEPTTEQLAKDAGRETERN